MGQPRGAVCQGKLYIVRLPVFPYRTDWQFTEGRRETFETKPLGVATTY